MRLTPFESLAVCISGKGILGRQREKVNDAMCSTKRSAWKPLSLQDAPQTPSAADRTAPGDHRAESNIFTADSSSQLKTVLLVFILFVVLENS